MKCDSYVPCRQEDKPNLADTLQTLIMQQGDPARVLECYYWSQEPGLVECVRAFLAMPADARAALQAFLAAAVVRESITAQIDAAGTLNLCSPEAASVLSTFFRSSHSSASSHQCN
jgi:hypothetical protein